MGICISMVVLSGMSNLKQVQENISLVDKFDVSVLTEEDKQTLKEAKIEYDKLVNIPCTACNYCMPCPFGVNIPKCFREYNMDVVYNNKIASVQYKFHLNDDRKAHNCVGCNQCITSCPQSINIPEELKKVEKHFGA